jgi:hypothetical protein
VRLFKLCCVISFILLISCYQGQGLSPPGNISGIEGRISFIGAWPDSTKDVWVVVFKNYPEKITDELALIQFVLDNFVDSTAVPLLVNQYEYQMRLDPGVYGWILVAWFPDIENWFMGVKELGAYYKDPDLEEIPTSFNVESGIMLEGIDIVADFANINRETPFFKPEKTP